MKAKHTSWMARLLRLTFVVGALIILSAAILAFRQPSSATVTPDITRIAIDTDITGNTVTPCKDSPFPDVDYPCNNSTVLGPVDNCRAIAVGQSIQIDIIGDSIPLGGTNGSNQNFQGAGRSSMALDWTPNGAGSSPIAVTGKDFSVALIHQGLDDKPAVVADPVTGANATSGHWTWTDVDLNLDHVGEGGRGIAIRLTITGLNAGTAVLTLTSNSLSQPTWADIHGNEYSAGEADGATIIVGGGTCGVDTAAPAPTSSAQTPSPTMGSTPTPIGQTASPRSTPAAPQTSGSSVPWIPLAAVGAGILAVLGGGLWYGRRRWLR